MWTVLIDTDADGYREFAAHLDGSIGSPSEPIDFLVGIYSDSPSQSIDYENNPADIFRLFHNPTGFVDQATNRILNFQSSFSPSPNWPNGSSETVWDYGTTRSIELINISQCDEYFIDYQIPLGMLDASGVGGPTITPDTPISLVFATANSLQNPLQKDAVLNGDFIVGGPDDEIPFGDSIIPGGGPIYQPIISPFVQILARKK